MNPPPINSGSENSERRSEHRYDVTSEAILSRLDPPFWQATAKVANVSGNGLLLEAPANTPLQIGARVKVRFGTATVTGQVRHLTLNDDCLLVGVRINDTTFDSGD